MTAAIWLFFGLIIGVGYTVFFGAPYVPSRRRQLAEALDKLGHLTDIDHVLDLGSGDGIVLRTVSARGARATGFEIHPLLVVVAKLLSLGDTKVEVKLASIWHRPFPDDVTLVYVFGDSRDIKKLVARIENEALRLKRPLRVISYGFELPGYGSIQRTKTHFLYKIRPLQTPKPQV